MIDDVQKEKQLADVKLIKETQSVCPICLKSLSAKIVEENGKVFLEKTCNEHGFFKEVYWSDAKLFKKFSEFEINGIMPEYAAVNTKNSYPVNCGLYNAHESQTLLAIIDVTNRCNLRCSYCFANAAVSGYVYEPTFEEIEKMMDVLRSQKPLPVLAVMFSGGEPTLRPDLVELVKKAREKGFTQVFIATNGIEIAKNSKLAKELQEAGVTTLYLKFNGITPKTSPENHCFMPQILENCRKAGLQITLVPTMINGFNDSDAYAIIKFALKNLDIVRGVNFQPVSFCGSMPFKERNEKRFTIPGLIKTLEKQSNGLLGEDSFYPIPSVGPLSALIEKLTGQKQFVFSVHPHCGAATYLFKDRGKVFPITSFVDVSTGLKEVNELSKETVNGKISKILIVNRLRKILEKNIVKEKAPPDLKLSKLLVGLLTGDFSTLLKFHMKTLFIGVMHFQDVYNLDVERVKKCGVHYATPDGKIISFCSYNALGYREKIERAHCKELKAGALA